MTTVINTPAPSNETGSFGLIIGIMGLVIAVVFFFYWGLPALRSMQTPQINVPSSIDVNVKQN
jgi:hypothetical protein